MQSAKYMRWAEKLATARRELDRIKDNVDTFRAVLAHDIRKNPDKYGIDKITVDAVKDAVLMATDETADAETYANAKQDLIDAQHDVEILQAAVRAMDHRKTALENLVRLHGAQYFAGPSVPRDLGKEMEAFDEKVTTGRKERVKAATRGKADRRKEELDG
jgi:hypothetical protein